MLGVLSPACRASPVADAAPSETRFPLLVSGRGSRATLSSASPRMTKGLLCLAQRTSAVAGQDLLSWLEIPADKASVSESAAGGLVTTRRVTRGQPLLIVPDGRWITANTVANSDIGSYVSKLPPWVQVALFILHEQTKSRSQWRAYLDGLPDAVDSPLTWPDEELESLLGGTQMLDSVLGYRQYFASRFEDVRERVFPQAPELFPGPDFSKERFIWAATVLRARVHAPLEGDSLALVPLADRVTHQRGPGVAWRVASGGGFGRGGRALTLTAERDFAAGEAVTMDFGPGRPDADVLLDYGALDELATQAGFTLNLSLPEDDRFFDDKADILEINSLTESQQFVLSTGSEPGADLLAYLRLLNLSGTDAFLLESLFRNDAWGYLLKPVSLENETAVFRSMIDGCREAMSGYGSSTAEDKAVLRSAGAGSREEKALRIRIGEKEALDATLQFFEERLGRLGRLEYYQERRLKGLGLLDEDGRSTFDDFFKDGIA